MPTGRDAGRRAAGGAPRPPRPARQPPLSWRPAPTAALLWWFAAGWLRLLAVVAVVEVLANVGTSPTSRSRDRGGAAANGGRRRAAGGRARTTTRSGRGRDRGTGSGRREAARPRAARFGLEMWNHQNDRVTRAELIVAGPTATAVTRRCRSNPPPRGHGCAEAYVPSLGRRIRAVNLGTTGFTTSNATQNSLAMSGATR